MGNVDVLLRTADFPLPLEPVHEFIDALAARTEHQRKLRLRHGQRDPGGIATACAEPICQPGQQAPRPLLQQGFTLFNDPFHQARRSPPVQAQQRGSHLRVSGVAKLVTVHFFDEV